MGNWTINKVYIKNRGYIITNIIVVSKYCPILGSRCAKLFAHLIFVEIIVEIGAKLFAVFFKMCMNYHENSTKSRISQLNERKMLAL